MVTVWKRGSKERDLEVFSQKILLYYRACVSFVHAQNCVRVLSTICCVAFVKEWSHWLDKNVDVAGLKSFLNI